MKYALAVMCGMAGGCLIMLLLQLPWLTPFNPNTATVVAALSSTVLAVIGAFMLWGYQNQTRQRDLDKVVVPIFEPLYAALSQVRDLGKADTAKALLIAVRNTTSDQSPTTEPTALEVANYQNEAFPRAVDAATVEAKSVLAHWNSLQDLLLGITPKSVPKLLALHRVASGAVEQLPALVKNTKPIYLEQIGPQIKESDYALLSWAIGRMANVLNELDAGHRNETGYHAIEAGRLAALKTWATTSVS
jgi:hypothetical protein